MKKMNYILMHKKIPVVELYIDSKTGTISSIGEVYEKEHIPVGISVRKGKINREALNNWWIGRSIPASRSGLKDALLEMNVSSSRLLIEKCLGLSLSDQYWICPIQHKIAWEAINFFENDFSDDVGNMFFGHTIKDRKIDFMSPNNTSDGWLKKKWVIIDGKRCLMKAGSGTVWQEPYNEVIASRIMDHLDIPHVNYTLIYEDGYPYSICENFVTMDTELIPAWYILQTQKKSNHVSIYEHYMNCASALGVPDAKNAIDKMLVLDYLIANEDRHQTNFGVLRDANTLQYIGSAPIYDSGTSLWLDKPTQMIGDITKVRCKPFKNSHEEQINLVSSFDWLDLTRLNKIEDEWMAITQDSDFLDERRRLVIAKALRKRITNLEQIIKHRQVYVDTTVNDVEEDIRYSN